MFEKNKKNSTQKITHYSCFEDKVFLCSLNVNFVGKCDKIQMETNLVFLILSNFEYFLMFFHEKNKNSTKL